MRLSDQVRQAIQEEAEKVGHNELSRRVGIHRGTLSNFLHGRRGLAMEHLDRLAEHLNWRLVTDSPAEPSPPKQGTKKRTKKRGTR